MMKEAVTKRLPPLRPGQNVQFVDLGAHTASAVDRMYRRPGLHVHAFCYGAVGEDLLQMFHGFSPPPVVYRPW
jgi:hypothetical protein